MTTVIKTTNHRLFNHRMASSLARLPNGNLPTHHIILQYTPFGNQPDYATAIHVQLSTLGGSCPNRCEATGNQTVSMPVS